MTSTLHLLSMYTERPPVVTRSPNGLKLLLDFGQEFMISVDAEAAKSLVHGIIAALPEIEREAEKLGISA